MPDLENTPEVTEVTETPAAPFEDTLLPNTDAVAEQIQKARAQEKAKLYPQMEKLQEELSSLRKKEEERAALEADRAAKRAEREAARRAEEKAKAEEEMSVKELLQTKEQEWQAKLDAERQEREKTFALLEQERKFQDLMDYRRNRLEQERDNIVPELIDLISGNTPEEIESSVTDLKSRSAKIFESVAAASQQTRKEMVGTKITMPASGPLDNDSDSRQYSPNDIQNMSLADYAKNRAKLLGNGTTRGQGLFGN